MTKFQIAVLFFFINATGLYAQAIEKDIHEREQLWLGYFNQTRHTDKFGLWLDVHYRQTDNFVERPFQLLIRPALNFFIKDNLRVQAGYAFVEHFPGKGLTTSRPEHRGWQQIWFNQKYTGLTTLQWLRVEERFNKKIVNDVLEPNIYFTIRLRCNYSFFIPLKGKELKPKTPFLAVIDEVFLNLGNNVVYNTFDQNRFFLGLGYQVSSHMNVQLGYMNIFQQEASGSNYYSTNAVRLFLFQTLDLRNNED